MTVASLAVLRNILLNQKKSIYAFPNSFLVLKFMTKL